MAQGAKTPVPAWPEGGEQRLATVLYTSGTTGQPKGVPLSHANLLHQLRHLGVAVAPQPGDRVLSVLPIWHAYERSAEYFLLACGCAQTYTTLKQLRPDLQRVRPHYLISVPRLWEALLGGFEDALAAMPSLPPEAAAIGPPPQPLSLPLRGVWPRIAPSTPEPAGRRLLALPVAPC